MLPRMPSTPDYLAYCVPCPLNAGKLAQVVDFVEHWRDLAEREAAWQWRHFFETGGREGFQASAKAGWTRPWVASGEASVTLAQQVMSQVAGQLKGYLGNVENTFVRLVAGSSLSSDDKHRLFSLNRWQLWLFQGEVKSPLAKESVIPEHIRFLGRKVFHRALAMHRKPSFRYYHPQLDQRSVRLQATRSSSQVKIPSTGTANTGKYKSNKPRNGPAFPLWATISTRVPGKTIDLPVAAWPGLMATIAATSQVAAAEKEAKTLARRERAAAKRETEGKPPVKSHRPLREAGLCTLPQTVRLMVRPRDPGRAGSPLVLSLGLVVDHAASRGIERDRYVPIPGKTVSFDLGGAILMATDEGDLLGRNWLKRLETWDAQLQGISTGQQKRGVPVTTPRYRALTQQVDGFLKTEIFRIVNAWVARVRPEKIVREATDFHWKPNLSRRLNRLFSRFGKRYLELALKRLESTHGIVVEDREAAYSSQQCASCGYIDQKNRITQSQFRCRFCGNTLHADVNAARVVVHRRSVGAPFPGPAQRKRLLHDQVAAFQAAHPFVSRATCGAGRPLVRGRKDDPRWGNPYFRKVMPPRVSEAPTPPSVLARA